MLIILLLTFIVINLHRPKLSNNFNMKAKAIIIQQQGDQDFFFGFLTDYPAICAQASSPQDVTSKLQNYSKIYFDYMSKMEIESEIISM